MRSLEEIVQKVREAGNRFLIFTPEVLVPHLPFAMAQEFLKPEVDPKDWSPMDLTREAVLAEMKRYMEFAWSKVEGHRGLSASRSVSKMRYWVWLLGDDEILERFQSTSYSPYGAPQLKLVSEIYGFPIPYGPGLLRMTEGQPCSPDCDGCTS
jgi:hypothetical protein